jgi:hypothetical protein
VTSIICRQGNSRLPGDARSSAAGDPRRVIRSKQHHKRAPATRSSKASVRSTWAFSFPLAAAIGVPRQQIQWCAKAKSCPRYHFYHGLGANRRGLFVFDNRLAQSASVACRAEISGPGQCDE